MHAVIFDAEEITRELGANGFLAVPYNPDELRSTVNNLLRGKTDKKKSRVLIVDDVISAGTSIRESFDIIEQHPAEPSAVCIALDRQEKGLSSLSASQEVSERYAVPVISIAGLDSLMAYTEQSDDPEVKSHLQAISDYRKKYGAHVD